MKIPDFVIKILRDKFRWVVLTMACIVIAIGYGTVLSTKVSSLQQTSFSDRERAKNELAAAELRVKQLEQTYADFQKNFSAQDIARLYRILPRESTFPETLVVIRDMAAAVNLEITSITVNDSNLSDQAAETEGTTTETANLKPELLTKDISLSVSGGTGYTQFKKFLTILEQSEQLFDVQSLNFTQPENTDGTATSIYTLTIRTYYLPDTVQTPS